MGAQAPRRVVVVGGTKKVVEHRSAEGIQGRAALSGGEGFVERAGEGRVGRKVEAREVQSQERTKIRESQGKTAEQIKKQSPEATAKNLADMTHSENNTRIRDRRGAVGGSVCPYDIRGTGQGQKG